jgi:hypothetical protein
MQNGRLPIRLKGTRRFGAALTSRQRPVSAEHYGHSPISPTGHFLSFAEFSKIASKRSRALALGKRTDDPETTFSRCTTLNVGQRGTGRERSGILSVPWGTAGGICRTRLGNPHARHLLHKQSGYEALQEESSGRLVEALEEQRAERFSLGGITQGRTGSPVNQNLPSLGFVR